MATWKITYGGSVVDTASNPNGEITAYTYNFPKNDDTYDKTYMVSYTSHTNCITSTSVTVPKKEAPIYVGFGYTEPYLEDGKDRIDVTYSISESIGNQKVNVQACAVVTVSTSHDTLGSCSVRVCDSGYLGDGVYKRTFTIYPEYIAYITTGNSAPVYPYKSISSIVIVSLVVIEGKGSLDIRNEFSLEGYTNRTHCGAN